MAAKERMRLTDGSIARLRSREREYTIWDSRVSGFGVRVRPSGGRSYVLLCDAGGRSSRVSLGPVSTMSTARARRECLARQAAHEPDKETAPTLAVPLLREFVEGEWKEAHFERYKPSTKKGVRSLLAGRILPAFGSKRLDRIAPARLRRWFDAFSRTAPGNANHALDLLRQIMNFAVACGHVEKNPTQGIRPNRRPRLTRFLSREEIGRLHRVLDSQTRKGGREQADIIRLLLLTARNKMGSGQRHTVLIGLANRFVETAILYRDDATLQTNLRAAVRLADDMRAGGRAPENGEILTVGRLMRDVPVEVVDAFLGAFRNHPGSPATESDPVRRYIALRADDELSRWDVLFAGVQRRTERSLVDHRPGFPLVCQRRASGKRSDRSVLMVTNKQRVSSRGITKAGLSDAQVQDAENDYDANNSSSPGSSTNYPDRIYTRIRTRPLLVIHLLAIGEEGDDLSKTTPVAAWSVSFPETRLGERTVEYVVNTTWYQEHYGDDDTDDNENDEDVD